jgi:hypothetical protein
VVKQKRVEARFLLKMCDSTLSFSEWHGALICIRTARESHRCL